MERFSSYIEQLEDILPLGEMEEIKRKSFRSMLTPYISIIMKNKLTNQEEKSETILTFLADLFTSFEISSLWSPEIAEKIKELNNQTLKTEGEWDQSLLFNSLTPGDKIEAEKEEIEVFTPENINILLRVLKVFANLIILAGEGISGLFKKKDKKGKKDKKKKKKQITGVELHE